jgi:hypothetical protein
MSASPDGADPPPPPVAPATPVSRWDHSPLDLKGLLASLASFAKAAQGLPVGEDFSFESSFPDFQKALKSAQVSWHTVSAAMVVVLFLKPALLT